MPCPAATWPALALLSAPLLALAASPDPAAPLRTAADHRVPGAPAAIVVVPQLAPPGQAQRIEIPLDGAVVPVDLVPHSLRAPGYRLLEDRAHGEPVELDPGPVTTLRGRIHAIPGSAAAGGLVHGGMYLTVSLPDGRQLWLEPAAPHIPGAPPAAHILYEQDDLEPAAGSCATEDRPAGPPKSSAPGATGHRGTTLHTADLACDADFEFYSRWGGVLAVQSRIEAVTAAMNLQFERDVDITHRIAATLVRTAEPDPYSATDPVTLNAQITAAWSGSTVEQDLIILYTGKNISGSVIGRANGIANVCNGQHSNCFAQSDFNGFFASSADLAAHELGHLWGACHCPCASPPFTMNSAITSINRFGGPTSFCGGQNNTAEIIAYRNTRACTEVTPSGPAPPNDSCAAAVPVDRGSWGYSTLGATPSTEGGGPPIPGCPDFAADIWYRFRSPCTGIANASVCTSDFDTALAVYSGQCGALSLLACSDDAPACSPTATTSRVTFSAAFGVDYLIRIGSPESGGLPSSGSGTLSITSSGCLAPSNNSCTGAHTVPAGEPLAFSTIAATTDGPLEPQLCGPADFQGLGADIWYRYTAACSGPLRISTCGAAFDSRLAVYLSCPNGPGQSLACSDNDGPACAGAAASLEFEAAAGTTYLVRVGGTDNQQGTGLLLVEPLACPPPPNNACASATPVSLGATTFDTLGASTDGGPVQACPSVAGQVHRDVWYHLTVPCDAPMRLTVCDTGFDSRLVLYSAPCSGPGAPAVACNDNSCGPASHGSQIIHAAPAGTQLLVRIGAATDTGGPGTLTVSIAGDWDRDGTTNSADIAAFLTEWLAALDGSIRDPDFSGDLVVNSADLSAFLTGWLAAVLAGC